MDKSMRLRIRKMVKDEIQKVSDNFASFDPFDKKFSFVQTTHRNFDKFDQIRHKGYSLISKVDKKTADKFIKQQSKAAGLHMMYRKRLEEDEDYNPKKSKEYAKKFAREAKKLEPIVKNMEIQAKLK